MKELILRKIKLEWVRLFLLNLQQQLEHHGELFLYFTIDDKNGFIKADIKHQSIHDIEICSVNEILTKDEEITDAKVLKILELLALEFYCHVNWCDSSVIKTDPEKIQEGLDKLYSLVLEGTDTVSVAKFLYAVQKVWEEELSDSDELYLSINFDTQELVARAYYENNINFMSVCELNQFVKPNYEITEADIENLVSCLKNLTFHLDDSILQGMLTVQHLQM